jgi:hypothetical protein
MKNAIVIVFVSLICCPLLLAGCMSTKPATQHYAKQLQQIDLGMTVEQFRTRIPKAAIVSQRVVDGHEYETYEITHTYMYEQSYKLTYIDRIVFEFIDGKLAKWGQAEAPPKGVDWDD